MGGSSSPKPPKPTAEEKATEYRTNLGLKKERARTETMLKNQARGKLGVKSLLGGIKPDTSMKQEDVVHSDAMSSEKRSSIERSRQRRERYARSALFGGIF